MAKTYRHLWPQVVAWENLCLAYRKCRRRKRSKPDAVRFDFAWESELLRLQRELVTGSYAPGPYHHFLIHDPKQRLISAAPFRDRVVHHAVVNVLEPLFERRFIHDSYACRRGKDKTPLRPSRGGLKFLGFVLWPEGRRLQQGALVRFNQRLRRWRQLKKQGLLTGRAVARSLQAWRAHAGHANAFAIQRRLCNRLLETPPSPA